MSWLIYSSGEAYEEAETFYWTLEDGSGVWLMEDGTSKWLQEAAA